MFVFLLSVDDKKDSKKIILRVYTNNISKNVLKLFLKGLRNINTSS